MVRMASTLTIESCTASLRYQHMVRTGCLMAENVSGVMEVSSSS